MTLHRKQLKNLKVHQVKLFLKWKSKDENLRWKSKSDSSMANSALMRKHMWGGYGNMQRWTQM